MTFNYTCESNIRKINSFLITSSTTKIMQKQHNYIYVISVNGLNNAEVLQVLS